MLRSLLGIVCLLLVAGCGEPVPASGSARVLLLGDSMFSANQVTKEGVANTIETALDIEVVDRSVPGASYFYPLPISGGAGLKLTAQYRPGPWDVIIVNGGGNDLLFGCGCGRCEGVLDRLISSDGRRGVIPSYVAELRKTGALIVYAGYLRNPGTMTPIKGCGPEGNELDRRLAALDTSEPGMVFLPMSDLVPYESLAYHQIDRIHPSRKGSREIGLRIARLIGPTLAKSLRTPIPPKG